MTTRALLIFSRLSKPIRAIEYIISIGILWATVVSLFYVANPSSENPKNRSAFPELIDRYEIVTALLGLMATLAIVDIFALLQHRTTEKVLKIRAVCTFGFTLGFAFVAVLTGLSLGIENILWVNEITLALISAVLYLNLRVNKENADR